MRLFGLILILVLSNFRADAASGTTGYELFRTDGFARSAGLAGSSIAHWGDLSSLQSNVAGLASMDRAMASAGFTKHVLDINQGTLAYGRPAKNRIVWAAAVDYLSYGTFDRADENGFREGEFGASDFQLRGGIAQTVKPELRVGAVLKYQYREIDGMAATALAGDVGLQYETGFNDWVVGAAIKSFGAATSAFLSERDNLPTSYELGFSVPLEHLPVKFSVAVAYVTEEGPEGRGGLEIGFAPQFIGRIGYSTIGVDQRTGLSSDSFAGFSAGLGLRVRQLAFDYALTSHGEIGFLNRFTIATQI